MGENEQGGTLRVVIVLALIAMLGVIFTKAMISQSMKVKNTNQDTIQKIDDSKNAFQSLDLNVNASPKVIYNTGKDNSNSSYDYLKMTTVGIGSIDWDDFFKAYSASGTTFSSSSVEYGSSDFDKLSDFHAITGDSAKNASLKSITLDKSKYNDGAVDILDSINMFNEYSSASELMSHYGQILNSDFFNEQEYLDVTTLHFIVKYDVTENGKTTSVTKNVTFEQGPSSEIGSLSN